MGYPMTVQRVRNRNRLTDGSYETTPADWFASGTAMNWSAVDDYDAEMLRGLLRNAVDGWNAAAERHNDRVRRLAGDLRRLEHDTVDEGAICVHIADKLGVDPEVVAAVLAEWLTF